VVARFPPVGLLVAGRRIAFSWKSNAVNFFGHRPLLLGQRRRGISAGQSTGKLRLALIQIIDAPGVCHVSIGFEAMSFDSIAGRGGVRISCKCCGLRGAPSITAGATA